MPVEAGRAGRRLIGDHQSADRAGLFAVVQQDRCRGARPSGRVDESIDATTRRNDQRPIAGLERLGGLAVNRHYANFETL